jgi:hypothetical protein
MSRQSVHFCFLLVFSSLIGRYYYDATIHPVQCHAVSDLHIGSLQWRCPGWAFQDLDNLCSTDGFRVKDHVCADDNLRATDHMHAEALCPADAYLCPRGHVRPKDDLRTRNHLCAEDNLCAQKSNVPISDSHAHHDLRPADHVRASPHLDSRACSEVGSSSEVILVRTSDDNPWRATAEVVDGEIGS